MKKIVFFGVFVFAALLCIEEDLLIVISIPHRRHEDSVFQQIDLSNYEGPYFFVC